MRLASRSDTASSSATTWHSTMITDLRRRFQIAGKAYPDMPRRCC